MEIYRSAKLHITDIDVASEHFIAHDSFIALRTGENGNFDYQKQICVIGSSFVSLSFSLSGWGYTSSNEIDGFLITIPHAESVEWRTNRGRHKIALGTVALIDQREVLESTYASNVKYTTLYIANIDLVRYLAVVLGEPPKTRVYFHKNRGEAWQIQIIQRLAETILEVSTRSSADIKRVTESLKESLIGFLLYNFPSNYTQVLVRSESKLTPTSHSINVAADYMAASVDPHLTVCQVATHAGLSVRSLQMGFKRFKQTTPIAFLREQRLTLALDKLGDPHSSLTPKEIAYSCGFTNFQLFCKYYIQRFGEHPNITLARFNARHSHVAKAKPIESED
ncbi:helix-turn-helix transcriptional regulator [Pseudomonas sp. CDFA 602]|uniref:helix-turn-helix transcriptional regulator n=1 Tax=Pseudomonas californiensis TaxID=2829823 RepID=UPI001E4E090E|nr:helix-turn-helix transcriptional regulator [Pseudomonas californiensis]MCD5996199.1 helix-turn-helix transcriptional regulator [Pseudomonas californiensis]MCD6001753.1 helix-turn-helix transcriptional regulator [Pseudomonas californiensis]